MSNTHANPVALVQIREGIAVLSVKAGNPNPLTMDAFGVRGFARHRGLALVNLQQHLVSSGLNDLPRKFTAKAPEGLRRDPEVPGFERRRPFQDLELIAKAKGIGFGVKVSRANLEGLAALDSQEVVEKAPGHPDQLDSLADETALTQR